MREVGIQVLVGGGIQTLEASTWHGHVEVDLVFDGTRHTVSLTPARARRFAAQIVRRADEVEAEEQATDVRIAEETAEATS